MEVGAWRMQSLLQVGIWEYRVGKKFLLFTEILVLCHSFVSMAFSYLEMPFKLALCFPYYTPASPSQLVTCVHWS